MNVEDSQYFRDIIIEKNWLKDDELKPASNEPSNERLHLASNRALSFLSKKVEDSNNVAAIKELNSWANYLVESAKAVVVVVATEVGAYRMFETLNDRGLRASQIDILKNYFFSRVKANQLDQIKADWTAIHAALVDNFNDPDEQMLRYIKYYAITKFGLIRDRDLASTLKKKNKNSSDAVKFVSEAAKSVSKYIAIFNSKDMMWKDFKTQTKDDLDVLTEVINIEQILPLVFAVACKFSKSELEKSIRLFVVWSVRLRLGGSGRAGRLDKQYADLAHDVGANKKTKAKALRDSLADKVPNDVQFERSAALAKVRQSALSRYYIAEIENYLSSGTGEKIPTKDVLKVNLEHIIPRTYNKELLVGKLDHSDLVPRLGNQTIMHSEWNRDLENKPFNKKKLIYKSSEIGLTNELADLSSFSRDEVDARQVKMAKAAKDIWTTKFSK